MINNLRDLTESTGLIITDISVPLFADFERTRLGMFNTLSYRYTYFEGSNGRTTVHLQLQANKPHNRQIYEMAVAAFGASKVKRQLQPNAPLVSLGGAARE